MIQDGAVTDIVNIQHEVDVKEKFFDSIFLGGCQFSSITCVSNHAGKITDFNIWSRGFSVKEMIDWTSCK